MFFLRSLALSQDFELSNDAMTIGRQRGCHICIADERNLVSKLHLEIQIKDGDVFIRDDQSRNNTTVNGQLIKGLGWTRVQLNDEIVLSHTYDFQLLDEDQVDESSGRCIVDSSSPDSELDESGSKSIPLNQRGLAQSPQHTQLQALLDITKTLRDVLQTEDVLEQATGAILKIFPAVERAAIGFFDDDQILIPKWWKLRAGDPQSVIRISQTLVQKVSTSSQAVLIQNAPEEFGDVQSVLSLPIRSVMCVPLIDADENVFGVIHVDSAKPGVFDSKDLEVLAAVAVQISLAIACSRLHTTVLEDAIIRRDVEQATAVQQRYIPGKPPEIPGYELAGFYRAARHIGGDYFDYISMPDGRLAIVLGDVVGKGVPAALTMVRLATETRNGLELCDSTGKLLDRLNQRMSNDFVTMVVLILDPVANTITVSNAGHESPLVRLKDGAVHSIGEDVGGCPLSVLDDEKYEETTVPIVPGESLIVFSDGFPDAEQNLTGKRLGAAVIRSELSSFAGSAEGFVDHLVSRVEAFTNDGPQFDDMCLVCLRRLG